MSSKIVTARHMSLTRPPRVTLSTHLGSTVPEAMRESPVLTAGDFYMQPSGGAVHCILIYTSARRLPPAGRQVIRSFTRYQLGYPVVTRFITVRTVGTYPRGMGQYRGYGSGEMA